MTGHTVATAPANKGVVAPLIHDLAAKSAVGVLGPNRHPETTAQADPKERCRDVGFGRIRKGTKPRTGPRDTIEAEVSNPMAIVRRDQIKWKWILMEVSRLRSGRLSGKKNYPTTSWHRPLSARNEHQSHPLAGQAQACGRLIRRMDRGPDGTC